MGSRPGVFRSKGTSCDPYCRDCYPGNDTPYQQRILGSDGYGDYGWTLDRNLPDLDQPTCNLCHSLSHPTGDAIDIDHFSRLPDY